MKNLAFDYDQKVPSLASYCRPGLTSWRRWRSLSVGLQRRLMVCHGVPGEWGVWGKSQVEYANRGGMIEEKIQSWRSVHK